MEQGGGLSGVEGQEGAGRGQEMARVIWEGGPGGMKCDVLQLQQSLLLRASVASVVVSGDAITAPMK